MRYKEEISKFIQKWSLCFYAILRSWFYYFYIGGVIFQKTEIFEYYGGHKFGKKNL